MMTRFFFTVIISAVVIFVSAERRGPGPLNNFRIRRSWTNYSNTDKIEGFNTFDRVTSGAASFVIRKNTGTGNLEASVNFNLFPDKCPEGGPNYNMDVSMTGTLTILPFNQTATLPIIKPFVLDAEVATAKKFYRSAWYPIAKMSEVTTESSGYYDAKTDSIKVLMTAYMHRPLYACE